MTATYDPEKMDMKVTYIANPNRAGEAWIMWDGLPGGFYLNDDTYISVDSQGSCWYVTSPGAPAGSVSAVLNTAQVLEKLNQIKLAPWQRGYIPDEFIDKFS